MSRPIAYEPHPVSPERKAELRAAGFRIIDAAFKPAEPAAAEKAEPAAPTTQAAAADKAPKAKSKEA